MTYFSLAALFIMFRETLEAAIIVAVLLQLMERLKMPELKRWGKPRGGMAMPNLAPTPNRMTYAFPPASMLQSASPPPRLLYQKGCKARWQSSRMPCVISPKLGTMTGIPPNHHGDGLVLLSALPLLLVDTVWIGAAAGVGVALIVGVVFIVLFYVANNSIFTGNAENLFKGFIFYIAVLLIVYVSFHMLKFYNLEKKWRYKLEQAFKEREVGAGAGLEGGACMLGVSWSAPTPPRTESSIPVCAPAITQGMKKSYRYTVAFLAFSATVREGIESVLFLTGVSGGQGITSVIIPGIVGAILGLIAGCIIFYT